MFKQHHPRMGCKERNVFQRTLLLVVYLSRFAANHSVALGRSGISALHEPGRLASNYIRFLINLVFMLRARLYCEDRKNIVYDNKSPHPMMGCKVRNVFQRTLLPSTRLGINFVASCFHEPTGCIKIT